jgi:hypothetical protein
MIIMIQKLIIYIIIIIVVNTIKQNLNIFLFLSTLEIINELIKI